MYDVLYMNGGTTDDRVYGWCETSILLDLKNNSSHKLWAGSISPLLQHNSLKDIDPDRMLKCQLFHGQDLRQENEKETVCDVREYIHEHFADAKI